MASSKEKATTPPVISHMSFTAFLNALKDAGAVPTRIDKTLMPKASGSQQSGMIAALRYLGFIDETGKPRDNFKSIVVADDDSRKHALQKVFQEAYAFLFNDSDFDLRNATAGEMTEKFRSLGISGSTLTKTIAFFLAAAKEYGIPVSPHIKPPPPPKGNGTQRRSKPVDDGKRETDGNSAPTIGTAPPGFERFEIPLPGKHSAKIIVPSGLDADNWTMLQVMLAAYIKRWKGFTDEEKS